MVATVMVQQTTVLTEVPLQFRALHVSFLGVRIGIGKLLGQFGS